MNPNLNALHRIINLNVTVISGYEIFIIYMHQYNFLLFFNSLLYFQDFFFNFTYLNNDNGNSNNKVFKSERKSYFFIMYKILCKYFIYNYDNCVNWHGYIRRILILKN